MPEIPQVPKTTSTMPTEKYPSGMLDQMMFIGGRESLENDYTQGKQSNSDLDNETWMQQRLQMIRQKPPSSPNIGLLPSHGPGQPSTEPSQPSFLKNLLRESYEGIKAIPELAAITATGMVAWPIAKAGGLMVMPFWGGKEAQKFENYVSQMYTYQPKGETAAYQAQQVGKVAEIPFKPAKWVGQLVEKITGSPEAKYGVTVVGEVATMFLIPKVTGKTKELIKGKPIEKPVGISDIAIEEAKVPSKEETLTKARGDLTAEMEKVNERARAGIEQALNEIPKEQWDKWWIDEKPKNIGEIGKLVEEHAERLKNEKKKMGADYDKLPQAYKDAITREEQRAIERAKDLDEIAKEADQAGADLMVVPEILKPVKLSFEETLAESEAKTEGVRKIVEKFRSMGEISRDLKTIIDLDERGSISGEGLSGEKLQAYYRLQNDFSAIIRNAKRVGKTVDQYLTDLGVDPEVVRFIGQKAQESTQKEGQQPTTQGLPTQDIRVNLDRIANSESVKRVISDINIGMQETGRIAETTRGVRPHEKTVATSQTQKGKITIEEVLTRRPGEIWNAEQMTSVRDLRDATAIKVKDLTDRSLAGDQQAINDLPSALAVFGEIEAQRTGVSAEIGRALESHKILSEGGRRPFDPNQLADLAQAVKDSAGDPVILARRIKALEKPEQIQTFARQLVNGLKKGTSIFNFAWINGLLSGPPTHAVNFLSNTVTGLGGIIERELASRIGQVGEVFGLDPGVKVGEAQAMVHGVVNGFMDAIQSSKTAWVENEPRFGGAKTENIVRNPLSQDYLGTTGAFGRSLEFIGNVIGGPGRGMMTSDEFWKALNYRAELEARAFREATAEGLSSKPLAKRINHIIENPEEFPTIDNAAKEFALYNTFNNELGRLGQAIMGASNATPFTKLVLPFVRTPTNIIKFSMERTPILNMMSKKFWSDVSGGGPQADLALAKISLGVMTTAAVIYLADGGYITGNGPTDKKTRRIWMEDHQPFSMKIGNKLIAYDRMDPFANVVGVAADATHMVRDLDLNTGEQLFSAIGLAFSNMMINKTYLQGMANALDAIKSPETGAQDYIRSWSRSLVPSVVRVTNRSFFDPAVREVNSISDAIKSQIPGWSEYIPPKRGFWGQPVVPEGTLGPDMFSPYRVKTETTDPVNEEILSNQISLSMPSKTLAGYAPSESVLGQAQPRATWGIKLSPDAYDRLVVLARQEVQIGGKNLHDKLEDLIKNPSYQRQSTGPDGGRALLIRTWVHQYQVLAEQVLMKEFPEVSKQIREQQMIRVQELRPNP